jgi:hypothetical protein
MIPLALAPLVEAIIGATAGGLGMTLAFSLVIFGATRFAELRRVHRPVAAAGYGVLSAGTGILSIGLVVLGVVLVTTK